MDVLHSLHELFDAAWGLSGLGSLIASTFSWQNLGCALRALAALWMIASTLACSLRLSRVLNPQSGVPLRWSSTLCVGMWLSTVGFHALRAMHAFGLPWALLACSALAAAARYAWPERAPLAWCVRRELRALRALRARLRRGPRVLWGVFTAFGALLALRSLIIPPLGWDTTTYHAPRAAQWVQSGKFTFDDGVGSYNFYRHFFSGGEVLSAWAMLPFHSDLLVNAASVVQWLGIGLGGWALARALGLREPFASTSAAVVMFVPTFQLEVSSGYVELALNATLLHGMAIAVLCLRRPSAGAALLCAMSLGVAAGIKLPGAPPAAIFASLLFVRLLATRRLRLQTKLATLGASALAALLPAAAWMVRAYRDTGYPLSPMPVTLLGRTLGVASAAMAWYGDRPQLQPYTWPAEKAALLKVFSPLDKLNESLGVMALLPLAMFPLGLIVLARRRPLAALAVALAALVPVLVHFSTGMTPVRLARSITASRFLLPTLALAIPVSLLWCRRGRAVSELYRYLLLGYPLSTSVLCLRRGWAGWEYRDLVVLGIALMLVCVVTRALLRRRPRIGAAFAVASFALGCAMLQVRRDETRSDAYHSSYALHDFPRFWADAVKQVDEPGKPHRIAITGGPDHSSDKWFHYFFLGTRLENQVRYIVPTRDGGVAHFGPKGELYERADLNSWRARLSAAGIDEVVSFPPVSLELKWMEATPERFEALANSHGWGLYRLKR